MSWARLENATSLWESGDSLLLVQRTAVTLNLGARGARVPFGQYQPW